MGVRSSVAVPVQGAWLVAGKERLAGPQGRMISPLEATGVLLFLQRVECRNRRWVPWTKRSIDCVVYRVNEKKGSNPVVCNCSQCGKLAAAAVTTQVHALLGCNGNTNNTMASAGSRCSRPDTGWRMVDRQVQPVVHVTLRVQVPVCLRIGGSKGRPLPNR